MSTHPDAMKAAEEIVQTYIEYARRGGMKLAVSKVYATIIDHHCRLTEKDEALQKIIERKQMNIRGNIPKDQDSDAADGFIKGFLTATYECAEIARQALKGDDR